ncbi:hypothetical protein SRABI118_00183 [Massilia sp. Bi118]|uniref:EF-hand domain-containing protein n=1 Tax=Massilia sp. Bi118 TaxID=2822346 RepID=UPI001D37C64A|nr:EF-hand domain-containing protein [Massilia sp. Bi118]CAH0136999.1 hypothetical protein SRABI118_00183 [Massilia sp. Bi118]
MVASISSNTVSNWADSVFSKLDTKNQGYIEKTDLQDALSKVGDQGGDSGQAVDIDSTFGALDGDSDGKVTKSELTDAMTKLGDQLNAQFDASRVGQGGPRGAGGPPPGGGGGRVGGSEESDSATDSTDGTSSTSTDYVAAADTDGDGTVSDAEQAAYDKKVASGQADEGGSSGDKAAGGAGKAERPKDPMRELAHALHLLKAYAENSGGRDSSTASTGDAGATSSVSVEA